MKKNILLYTLLAVFAFGFVSCDNDEVDSKSVVKDPVEIRNDFDNWLDENFLYPYNVTVLYKYTDFYITDSYRFTPAEYKNSVVMAKMIKFLLMDCYGEAAGNQFLKTTFPRIITFVGDLAINNLGTAVAATAESGVQINIFNVNGYINADNPLNSNFSIFKTFHHEFAHILHQQKIYSAEFRKISAQYYQGDTYNENTGWRDQGFVSQYSSKEENEDFADMYSIYITSTQAQWQNILNAASDESVSMIQNKLEILRSYFKASWGMDIDEMRAIFLRRRGELSQGLVDLSIFNL